MDVFDDAPQSKRLEVLQVGRVLAERYFLEWIQVGVKVQIALDDADFFGFLLSLQQHVFRKVTLEPQIKLG